MSNKQAVLIKADDEWEGLYVSNKLVEEGDPINEGVERLTYFAMLARLYNFNLSDILVKEPSKELQEEIYGTGNFPEFWEEEN
ncbi:MAG TPA: hypothetical protein DCL21_07350 [Alphaproteobacteria bacterium]|nr:hypothetical protein [Alphaproteobacteria bacterium]